MEYLVGLHLCLDIADKLGADLTMEWKRTSFSAQMNRDGAALFGNGTNKPDTITLLDVAHVLKTLAVAATRFYEMERKP
jgi:hypothetical protein